MKKSVRNTHYKLESIMRMIEKSDKMISMYVKQMEKYDDMFWKNEHAKRINRFIAIRNRLYAFYAEVFTRQAEQIASRNLQIG